MSYRPITGQMQFPTDAGIFIRGDNAADFVTALRTVLKEYYSLIDVVNALANLPDKKIGPHDYLQVSMVESLVSLLAGSNVANKPDTQKARLGGSECPECSTS
jgi:hypothetical protein